MRLSPLVVLLSLAACASQEVVDRFDRVTPGMTRDEVIAMLGKPSSTWPLSAARDGIDGERLQWGDGLSSLASSAAFKGEPERAYSVVLDTEGKVVRATPPTWVDAEEREREVLRERRDDRSMRE
jgi:hypothetical protein